MARKTAPTELIWRRRSRASLMRSTALQAAALAVLATPAAAQLAPGARPTGGSVTAGQASIANSPAKTTITQSSENAAINWQSYNVGSAQTVQYKQPNAAAVTLNRVVGPDPSQIAGHILANGQIVLVNQSGVVFAKGAQVDTAGLVVSTAGITDKNFMSGKLVFDQAGHLGASISNAGNITIRQAGLAALVAPQVANSGTITARLGRVILGGAETHTLDLYGDGLVALNVTGQVTKASVGGRQVTALVTNSGTILAPGGTVVLSASAVDGVVTNLVEAGGKIAAPSLGGQTGRVLVQGIGGGISIDGDVSASGVASGTKGGQVVANATGAVRVGGGAVIDASGDAGGGVIAIGTTAARALGGASVAPTLVAQSVSLAPGAQIRANATRRGAGGRIAVLSRQSTTQSGAISARGGVSGGDGGWIEVSGGKVAFGGPIDVGAAAGKAGSILIDPANMVLGADGTNRQTTYIDEVTFLTFSGDVILKADGDLTVAGPIATAVVPQLPAIKTLQLEGDLGIAINSTLNVPGVAVALQTNGAITESSAGLITAGALSAQAGGPITLGSANKISDIAYFSNVGASPTGAVTSLNADGNASARAPQAGDEISVTGLNAAGNIQLNDAASLSVDAASTASNGNGGTVTIPAAAITASGGNVSLTVSGTTVTVVGNTATTTPNTLSVGADITGQNVTLATTGTVASFTGTAFAQTAGTISAIGGTMVSGTGSTTTTTTFAGAVSIKTAQGALSIGGAILTSSPGTSGVAGETSLTASIGDITEVAAGNGVAGGSIGTGTLTGGAGKSGTGNLPGNANFAIANGNTISTLTGFTTAGSFALEDDSKLTVASLTSGTTIAINNAASSTGTAILVIDGPILAAGDITLSNTLGIAELTNATVGSTSGGVTLGSGGGILTQTLSALTARIAAGTGIVLASQGATDFGTALGTAALGTVTGMSLGGSITAGALAGHIYTGNASIVATDGSIQQTGGGIHVDTLFASASDSTATTPLRNLLLSVSNGNTISNINALTATGSMVVEDDVALNVDVLTAGQSINVHGPGTASVTAPGLLTLSGSITAGGSITLQNTIGILATGSAVVEGTNAAAGVTLASGGAILLQQGGLITGAATTGTAVALSAAGSTAFSGVGTLHGIEIDGAISAGTRSRAGSFTGALSLVASAGDIDEGAQASLLTGTLTGSALAGTGSTGSATLTAAGNGTTALGNSISVLGSFSTAGNFALLDQSGLTVDRLGAGGSIAITGPSLPGDVLLLAGNITAGTIATGSTALFSNALGVVELKGATITGNSTAVTLISAGGAVVQEAGSGITAGSLSLQAGGTTTFDAGLGLGTVGGLAFNGSDKANAAFLSATGAISEGPTATLLSGVVVAQASGGLQLAPGSGNQIGTLSGYAHGGDVLVEDDSALSIGNLSASGALTVREPSAPGTQTGSLTITGLVTATDAVSLSNKLGITEQTGAAISSATGTVTLSTAGAISQQVSSTIAGGTTSGTGTLVVLSVGTGISLNGTVTAGTLSGAVPTGIVSLTATTGDIIEGTTGALGAQSLAGGAAAGSASFTSTAGNEIGTLSNFAVGADFALEDDAGLVVLGQSALHGSIDIFGPPSTGPGAMTPGGFLVVEGNVTAHGNITISNSLGVAELAGADIHSTSGGVSLVSIGGAVFEQAGATIEGDVATGTLAAVAIETGGHSTFGTQETGTNLTPIYGIAINGTVLAGTLNAGGTAYSGSAYLAATRGDVTEGTLATIGVGSLTVLATGGGVQGSEPVGNVSLVGTGTNLISAIGSASAFGIASADGNIVVTDGAILTLGTLHAGGSISVQDNAGSKGILIIGGAVSAGGSIDLANALGIAELGTGSVASTAGTVSLASSGGAILQLAGGKIEGGTASGAGTWVTLSAGGTTTFGNYQVSAPNDPVAGIAFGGLITSGAATSGVYAGTAAFTVSGGGIAEADTGSLRAAVLTGSIAGAADAVFTTTAAPGNVVGTLSAFAVGGSFSLEDDSGLVVLGGSAGGSIVLKGPATGMPSGALVLDGALTASGPITLDNGFGIVDLAGANVTSTGAGVAISSAQGAFAQHEGAAISAGGTQGISITANGGTDFSKVPLSGFTSLSGITFNGTLDAGSGAAILTATGGNITEGTNASLQAASLSGTTSGAATLDFAAGTGSNLIAAIGTFSSTGNTSLEDSEGLTIDTLKAGGNVDIHGPLTGPSTGILTLTGVLSAAGGTVTLNNAHGISLGGTLTAGSLSGLVYTGVASLTVGDGDIVETAGSSLRAGTLLGSATGTVSATGTTGNADFAAGTNLVGAVTSFTTTGNFTLSDTAGLVLGTLTAGGGIGISGTGAAAPADFLQVAGPVLAGGGITLANSVGIVELSGASVQSTGGSIALTSFGGGILQQGKATLRAETGLSLDAGGSSNFGTLLTGQSSGVVDGISFAGSLAAVGAASLTADDGNIVEQGSGVLQAASLSAAAHTSLTSIAGSILLGSQSSASTGNQVGSLAASSAAAGFAFVDGQSLTVTGAVFAGGVTAANLEIVAPSIDVTTGSLQLQAPANTKPGVIDLVADQFLFASPGAVSTPGGLVALDLLNAGGSTIFAVGGATISGNSLGNIQSQRGTLSIGQALDAGGTLSSVSNTGTGSWGLGAVGKVTAIDFSQAVDFGNAASPAALGLFSADSITVSNGITVASLYGSAGSTLAATGTASFLGSNAIGTLGVIDNAGQLVGFVTTRAGASGPSVQFQLADTVPLLVLGPVTAGQGAVKIAVTGDQNGVANTLTIGSAATPLSGQITGTDIALGASGNITQAAGTLDATGAATGTNGTVAIASSAGAVTLDSTVEAANTRSALLLDAGGGNITEGTGAQLTAGTLAALASGSISLGGTANSFAVVGSLSSLADGVTLYGLSAAGAGGIVLNDAKALLIADDTVVGNTRQPTVFASGGPVDILVSAGGLSVGSTMGATIEASGPVNLTAPGFITQTGGTISSQNAGATLSTLGSISQIGGTLLAGKGDVDVTAPSGFTQIEGALIRASGAANVTSANGSFTQISSSIIGGDAVVLNIGGGIAQTGASSIAAATGTVVMASKSGGIGFDSVDGGRVLLSAGGGDITEAGAGLLIAGTLAAAATGNIDLASNSNQILNIGGLSSQTPALTLAGLVAGGGTGITLVDNTSLNILADTHGAVVQANSAGATLSIDVIQAVTTNGTTTYGALTIGSFGASTLQSSGAASLSATGDVTLADSTVKAGGDVSVIATNGNIDETAGSVIDSGQDAGLSAGGTFYQNASSLFGTHGVGLTFGGAVTSTASTIQSAGMTGDATSGTIAISAGGSMALESLISAGKLGAVHLSALDDISQVSADGSLVGTIVAPSLAAAAGGNLSLTGPNQVAAITAAGPLTGLSAGTGNLDFVDTVNLTVSPSAAITALNGTIGLTVAGAGAPGLVSNGATLHALGDIDIAADGLLTQNGGLFQSDSGSVKLASNGFSQTAGGVVLADVSVEIAAGPGPVSLAGTLQAGSATNGIYGGAIGISTTGNILAPTATLLAGTLAASGGATLNLNSTGNQIAQIGTVGSLSGITGGTITLQDGQSLLVASDVIGSGGITFTIPTADFTELPGVAIDGRPGPLSVVAGGAILIGGVMDGASASLSAGGALTEQTGAMITAGTAHLSADTVLTIDGTLTTTGTASLSAGTDFFEGAGALIETNLDGTHPAPLTLTAAGTITLDGLLQVAGPLSVTGGTVIEDATGVVTAEATSISATNAAGTFDGVLTANGPLSLFASTDIEIGQGAILNAGATTISTNTGDVIIAGQLTVNGALAMAAGANLTEAATGTVIAGATTLTAMTGQATIGGRWTANGTLGLTAATDVTLAQGGTLAAGATSIAATQGAATIDGVLTVSGPLALSAGTNFDVGPFGQIAAGDTTIAAKSGTIGIAGLLGAGGTLSLTAGTDVDLATTGTIKADATTITATNGNATIDGLLSVTGPLTLSAANNVTLDQPGTIAAGTTTIAASGGSATIDGLLTANGALGISGGADVTFGQSGRVQAGATTIEAKQGMADIEGSLTANGTLGISAGNGFSLGGDGNIMAGDTTIQAGSGNATFDGALTATGSFALTAGGAFALDPTGYVAVGPATIGVDGAATIGGKLIVSGPLGLTAGTDVTLSQGGSITADATTITATNGNATIDGALTAYQALNLAAAGNVTEGQSGTMIGSAGLGLQAKGGSVEIAGIVQSAGGFVISAGADVTEDQGASIAGDVAAANTPAVLHGPLIIPSTGGSIGAGGNITIDGALTDPFVLTLTAGNAATLGATGTMGGGLTSITATLGAVTLAGPLTASGDLTISAGTDLLAEAMLSSGGTTGLSAAGSIAVSGRLTSAGNLTASAGADFTITSTGQVVAAATDIKADGLVTIDGPLTANGALTIQAGTGLLSGAAIASAGSTGLTTTIGDITLNAAFASAGSLSLNSGGSVTIAAPLATGDGLSVTAAGNILGESTISIVTGNALFNAGGDIAINGQLADAGTLGLSAGADITLGQTAAVTAGATTLGAGGNAAIDGALTASGSLSITAAASFSQAAGGTISGAPVTVSAINGAVTIDGALGSGAGVTITAGTDIDEGTGASIGGVPISLAAKGGAVTLDGDVTSQGAFTIGAHTNITQGAGSTIKDSQIAALGLSSSIAAPGTITLGGTLSASSLLIGDFLATSPVTQSIVWNDTVVQTGSNATIHGATSSISIAAPLVPGKGAFGVYTQSSAFQQTGTSTVSAIAGSGPSATLQVGIEGRGAAKFAQLLAPDTQLLLVLEQGGSASGQVDVAGLNVFYTTGVSPLQPAALRGEVGGRGGFAAAAVGFSHHLPNVNYQINGCPIESINCILLSPLLVPIVDPVNDYAEGTQRKRHQDDDALPNVGEEDY